VAVAAAVEVLALVLAAAATATGACFAGDKAMTACRLLVMNREKFLFAVQETPMFAIELLASIDQRLRQLKITDRRH
jgi:CRP-like cAMP-binding protein